MEKAQILVVDDESGVRELVGDVLELEGYNVTVAVDGLDALSHIRKQKFDLYVLDINMPKIDGLVLLEKVRAAGDQTPALLLSARREKDDIHQGFRIGADDYVTKPFSIEELALRVEAILRRTQSLQMTNILRCGPISIDVDQHMVMHEETVIELSPTEYNLLHYLIERKNKVVRKDALLNAVWGIDFESNSTVVETYISYLRKKLHRDGFEGIKTVRGVGFQIVERA
ncbi:MAG TPA: response regulator transcription factor [Candidatus Nanopelagicaceae bacterium]